MTTECETKVDVESDSSFDLEELLNLPENAKSEDETCKVSTQSEDVQASCSSDNPSNGLIKQSLDADDNDKSMSDDDLAEEDSAGASSQDSEDESTSVNNSSPEKSIENGKRKAATQGDEKPANGKKKKKKKKSSDPNRRRNIKKVKSDDELALEVREARKEEEERIKRQTQMFLDFKQNMKQQSQQSSQKVIDEIYLSSDDDEPAKPEQIAKSRLELIELLDSDSDDTPDVKFEDDTDDSDQVDFNNCGLFTDDKLNIPNESGKVLINVGHGAKEEDIYLSPQIARAIKPHQIGGVRFMYANIVESRESYLKSPGVGCILAHSMGLGKTIQVISFIDVFFRATPARTVLCVVPINTLQNWVAEFDRWLPANRRITDVDEYKYRQFTLYVLNDCKTQEARCKEIVHWKQQGGVMLLGYEMYRILSLEQFKLGAISSELMEGVQQALVDPGPDLVVCDEGHRIKNCHSSISKALKKLKTKRRIVLTGYPLQNNLMEYWCMVDWVRPNYLGTDKDFANMFEKPIKNGQCQDSTYEDRRKMRYRAHVLYHMLRGFVQRRSQSILKSSLPPKIEYVFLISMTPIQRALFAALIEEIHSGSSKLRAQPILLFSVCNKIWNHPDILFHVINEDSIDLNEDLDLGNSASSTRARKKITASKSSNSSSSSSSSSSSMAPSSISNSYDFSYEPVDNFNISSRPLSNRIDYDWARKIFTNYKPNCLENSYKMSLLFTMIDRIVSQSERLLLFSQSLLTLNIIEKFLSEREVPGKNQKWKLNNNYYRLDGSTSATDREKLINTFNRDVNIQLFLLSTRAGSLGINLIGANRIIVFDASWNPCHDAQAACRIYRYGQTKNCFIYRLICDNSLEKVIYDRQISKEGLSHRVVDELNPETNIKEIASLLKSFNVQEVPPLRMSPESIEAIPDPLVQEICANYPSYLTSEPFQHESLLLDQKETKLTQTEKIRAFENYKADKQAKEAPRTYGNYGSYSNTTPMTSGLLSNPPNFFESQLPYPNGNHSMMNGLMPSTSGLNNFPSLALPNNGILPANFPPSLNSINNSRGRPPMPSILGRPRTALPPGGSYNPNYNSNYPSTSLPSSLPLPPKPVNNSTLHLNSTASLNQTSSTCDQYPTLSASSASSSTSLVSNNSFPVENGRINLTKDLCDDSQSVDYPYFGRITREEQLSLDDAKRRLSESGYVFKFASQLPHRLEMTEKGTDRRTFLQEGDVALIYGSTGSSHTVFLTRDGSIVDATTQPFQPSNAITPVRACPSEPPEIVDLIDDDD